MRPLSLSFEHFSSYRARQYIDFSQLDDFFLIYGKTGSGKTTIFDAIAYALYGEALGGRSNLEHELASKFSPPESKPWVEYEFFASGECWKVYRTLPYKKRNRKGNVSEAGSEAALFRKNASGDYELVTDRISEVNERLLALLHLSAAEFSKIVLLPQGQFQEFLEMKTTDRVDILEKLFDVEIYDRITEIARQKLVELDASLRATREEKERIDTELGEHPENRIDEAQRAVEEIDTRLEDAAQEAAHLEVEIERNKERLDFWQQLSEAWNTLASAERQKPAFDQRKQGLEAAKSLTALATKAKQVSSQHNEMILRMQKALRAAANLVKLESEHRDIEHLESILPDLREKRGAFQRNIALLQKAIETWKQKSELEKTVEKSGKEMKAASDEYERRAREIGALKTEIAALEGELSREPAVQEKISKHLVAGESLRRIDDRLAQQEKFEAERQKILRKISGTEDFLATLAQEISSSEHNRAALAEHYHNAQAGLLAASLVQGQPCPVCGSTEHPAPAHIPASLPDELALMQANLDIEEKKEHQATLLQSKKSDLDRIEGIDAEIASILDGIRADWKSFKDQTADFFDTEDESIQNDDFRAAFRAANSRHTAIGRSFEVEASGFREKREALATKKRQFEKAESDLAIALQNKSNLEVAYAGALARLESLVKQLDSKDPHAEFTDVQKQYALLERDIQSTEQRVQGWQVSYGSSCAEMEIHLNDIIAKLTAQQHSLADFLDDSSVEEVERRIAASAYAERAEMSAATNTSSGSESVSEGLEELIRLVPGSERWKERARELREKKQALSSALTSYAVDESRAIGLVAKVIQSNWPQDRIQREEAVLGEFRESYAQARASYEVLASRAPNLARRAVVRSMSVESHTTDVPLDHFDFEGETCMLIQARQELDARKEKIQISSAELRTERAARGADLEHLRSLKARQEALSREYASGIDEFGKRDMLAKLLSGNLNVQRKMPFKNYVLGLKFEEIASRASERMYRMSNGRYVVEADILSGGGNRKIGLELFVIDAWNGAKRPVGTLSGGEKFMLSISLALGLADSIQERANANRIESLFIDEGFGSLDEESLSLAITVLDELRGDKKIAIISHVEELYNRIPSRIVVTKGAGGSRLTLERD